MGQALRWMGTRAPALSAKVRARMNQHRPDPEIRQLRSLQRAYASSEGPELLIFGDSAMLWSDPRDKDSRNLAEMIRDEVGQSLSFELIMGPGYNPRLVMAFLAALDRCAGRPKLVIVPTSVLMAGSAWIGHPAFGYRHESAALVEIADSGDRSTKRLPRAADKEFNEYDRLPAPSLFGARRTYGELRLVTNAKPLTQWQRVVRLRHLMDHYNAERLQPDSVGVAVIAELAEMLARMNLPGIAYIAPIDHETVAKFFGQGALAHLRSNVGVVRGAFLSGSGGAVAVADAAFVCSGPEFGDPIHLAEDGRVRLAQLIATTVRRDLPGVI